MKSLISFYLLDSFMGICSIISEWRKYKRPPSNLNYPRIYSVKLKQLLENGISLFKVGRCGTSMCKFGTAMRKKSNLQKIANVAAIIATFSRQKWQNIFRKLRAAKTPFHSIFKKRHFGRQWSPILETNLVLVSTHAKCCNFQNVQNPHLYREKKNHERQNFVNFERGFAFIYSMVEPFRLYSPMYILNIGDHRQVGFGLMKPKI